ncbi:MAG: hypothetical protein IM631_12215 [Cytophagales bacterium]|nr:hypothetical protein [Cytophagales bacterium]MCA6372135.1 hypothetical protein [Cytophagales bacterium]MCA6382279.1 hypothetical protein [Cytophagales bacterium]
MSANTHLPVVILYKPSKTSETSHSFSGSSMSAAESMIPESYSSSKRSIVIPLDGFKKLLASARCAQADLTGLKGEELLTESAEQTMAEISTALSFFPYEKY